VEFQHYLCVVLVFVDDLCCFVCFFSRFDVTVTIFVQGDFDLSGILLGTLGILWGSRGCVVYLRYFVGDLCPERLELTFVWVTTDKISGFVVFCGIKTLCNLLKVGFVDLIYNWHRKH